MKTRDEILKPDWRQKITNKKFWVLVAGVAVAILTLFKVPEDTISQVVNLIEAIGQVISYMW